MELTWEQKLEAMNTLAECRILMRKPKDWYIIQPGVEIKHNGMLGSVRGDGIGPFEAVTNKWNAMTILEPGEYIVIHAMREDRQAFKWNGFMWERINEKQMQELHGT